MKSILICLSLFYSLALGFNGKVVANEYVEDLSNVTNSLLVSEPSSGLFRDTKKAPPLTPPYVNPASSISTSSFTVTWNHSLHFNSFKLYVSTNSSFSGHVSGYNGKSVTGRTHTVTGLTPGKTYWIRMKTVSGSSLSSYSTSRSVLLKPSSPTLSVGTVTNSTIQVTWPAVTGATQYRYNCSNGTAGVASSPKTISGLSMNTSYTISIIAVNASGSSSSSKTVLTLPTAPGVSAASSVTTNSFQANWGHSASVGNFKLYVSTNSSFSSHVSGYNGLAVTGRNKVVSGLTPGKKYWYRLKATNSSGASGYSSSTTSITTMSTPSISAESNKTTTSFRANWGSVTGATSYKLYVSATGTFGSHLSGYNGKTVTGTNYTVTGLTPGRNYYYRVKATSGVYTTGYSSSNTANTTLSTPSISAESNKTTTSFRANWGSVTGATSYRLYISENSSFSIHLSGYNYKTVTGTNYTVTGLTPGKNYYYRVKASSGIYTTGYSSSNTANTTLSTPVVNSASDHALSSFIANWGSVTGATSYLLYVSMNSSFTSHASGYDGKTVIGTSQAVTGLIPGMTYYYRVKAKNSVYTTSYSSVSTAYTTIPTPGTPVETNQTATSFVANWSGVMGATSFLLYVSENSGFSSHVSGYSGKEVTSTSVTVSGLTPSKNYYFRVKAKNSSYTTGYSGSRTVMTLPQPPGVSNASNVTASSFQANWSHSMSVNNFKLYVSTNSSFSSYVSGYNGLAVTGRNKAVTGLTSGKTYWYRLKATNSSGASSYSSSKSVITKPVAPTLSVGTVTNSSIQVTWPAVTGATQYRYNCSNGTAGVASSPKTISGLSMNTSYTISITAINASGSSSSSKTVLTLPTAPGVSAASSVTTNSFQANWGHSASVGNFKLYVSENSSFSSHVSGYNGLAVTGRNKAVTGLTSGKTYWYRLKATNSSGSSGYSSSKSVITKPKAPTVGVGTVTSSYIKSSWPAVTGATSYSYTCSDGTSGSATSPLAISGLSENTSYTITVSSANSSGSTPSPGLTVKTLLMTPGATGASSIDKDAFTATWGYPASSGATFELYVYTDSGLTSALSGYNGLPVTGRTHRVEGLDANTRYWYRVKAVSESNESAFSTDIEVLTAIPSPVVTLSKTTYNSFVVSWEPIGGVTTYQVRVGIRNINGSVPSAYALSGYDYVTVNGTSLLVSGLGESRNYYVQARSVADQVYSDHSTPIVASTNELTSRNQNYVMTVSPRSAYQTIDSYDHQQMDMSVSYFDGLGRKTQDRTIAASPGKNDIVQHVVYDEYGREHVKYLPVTSGTLGNYQLFNKSDITAFYAHTGDAIANDDFPFAVTVFEPSPLNRVLKQGAPGQAWQPDANLSTVTDHAVHFQHGSNTANGTLCTTDCDDVILWKVENDLPIAYAYDHGQLFKNTIIDEQGNQSEEFTDKRGRVVLKTVKHNYHEDATSFETHYTYYVYDDLGNLRFVLPPMIFDGNQSVDAGELDAYAFQYRYDAYRRMTEKKVPGAGWVYLVYDDRDRLVLTQDANQRADNQWIYTQYDILNRPVITGIYQHDSILSQSEMQTEVNNSVGTTTAWCETYDGSGTYGYDGQSFPTSGINEVLTVTYYDHYGFASSWSSYTATTNYEAEARGHVTGGLTRVLGGNMLKSVTYYDSRYRPIETITENHLGGVDHIKTEYRNIVNSEVLKTTRWHSTSVASTTVVEDFTYDHAGRLLTTTTTIGGESSTITHAYNELGELIEKDLDGLQSMDYAYNIRGWLTHINNGTGFDDPNDQFGMKLAYTTAPTGYEQYNGNIGQILWKTPNSSTSITQAYKYTYDEMNRLKKAIYGGTGMGGHYTVTGDDAGIRYDLNGNIEHLIRYQSFGAERKMIDRLIYTYQNGGVSNQLAKVKDTGSTGSFTEGGVDYVYEDFGFLDGINVADEYLYDANGNMTQDLNKGITDIDYNHLNLPDTVVFNTSDTIFYTYDAAGTKLRKRYKSASGTMTTDYIGGIHYEQDVGETNPELEFVQTAEGRYAFTDTDLGYQYDLKDHLGNSRVTLNSTGDVIQSQDYYPFGLTFNSYTSGTKNNYLYNQGSKITFQGLEGKIFPTERQPELGIDLTKYRAYDPALGRWWQVDPMADSLEWQSPYNGMDNNPVRYNDPNGDCPLCITAGVGALVGGIAGAAIAAYEGKDAEGIAIAALGGAVSGAIIGSGAGLIATTAVGGSVAGVVATNAAAGLVAGTAESVTVQALEGEGINTAEAVEAGAASMFANVVAGPLGGAIETQAAKVVSSEVAASAAQNTAKVAVEITTKVVENEIQEVLD